MVSTSFFKEVEDKEKKISIIGPKYTIENYERYWTKSENADENLAVEFCEIQSNKDALEKICSKKDEKDLVMCHLNADLLSEEKKVAKIAKWTKKLWNETPSNGLFVTVWTGTPIQKAFVGIALNKQTLENV